MSQKPDRELPVLTGEAYWKLVRETAAQVGKWPAWKRGDMDQKKPDDISWKDALTTIAEYVTKLEADNAALRADVAALHTEFKGVWEEVDPGQFKDEYKQYIGTLLTKLNPGQALLDKRKGFEILYNQTKNFYEILDGKYRALAAENARLRETNENNVLNYDLQVTELRERLEAAEKVLLYVQHGPHVGDWDEIYAEIAKYSAPEKGGSK